MENSVIQRITELQVYKGVSSISFAETIGFNYSTLNNYFTRRSTSIDIELIKKIASSYDDGNIDWLITGQGEMIKKYKDAINHERKGSPYYNVDFIGEVDIMLSDQTVNPDYYIDFEPYNKPGVVWCNITGHSRKPAITHGDVIAMQEVKSWREFLLMDEVYGLVTEEFRTFKKVSQSEKDGYYKLIFVNGKYNSQDIPVSIIRKVFKVFGSVKRFKFQ